MNRPLAGVVGVALLVACGRGTSRNAASGADSAFAAVQTRGKAVMGVDQYTSAHVFEDLADGGRIVLDRNESDDTSGIGAIRTHMREVATDFRAGNFSKPFAVHAQRVPGTDVMAAKRSAIAYEVADRQRGAEVRIRTADTSAIRAIHDFLAFQRSDHRATGHEGMDPAEHAMHMAAQPASCAPPASSIAKTGAVTRLRFANGDTASLRDEPNGDGQVEYESKGYLGSIGYFIVRMKMWGGPSYWYEAYNACTGTKLAVDNLPVVSPDSLHFVTVGYGVPLTPLVKRVQVLSRDRAGELTMDWDFELGIWNHDKPALDWGPVNPRWTSGASLKFDRADRTGQIVGTATAMRDAGGWHFSVTQ